MDFGQKRRVGYLLVVLCAVGCGVNDKDLSIAANAYYGVGSSISIAQRYKLLSKSSKEQLTEAEFEEFFLKPIDYQVAVLGEEQQGDNTYAKIMLTESRAVDSGHCKRRTTRTWLKEDGRWRALFFLKLQQRSDKQYESGDYAAALQSVEAWLRLDPFSVAALKSYIYAQARSGSLAVRETRSQSDVIRSMLAININLLSARRGPDLVAIWVTVVTVCLVVSVSQPHCEPVRGGRHPPFDVAIV